MLTLGYIFRCWASCPWHHLIMGRPNKKGKKQAQSRPGAKGAKKMEEKEEAHSLT